MSEWLEATLGDVADWGSGSTPKATARENYGGGINWATIGDLRDGPLVATKARLSEEGAHFAGKPVPLNSVLISMYGTIGRTAISRSPMYTNQAITWGKAHASKCLDDFLLLVAQSLVFRLDRLGRGATQRNINRQIVKEQKFVLPSLAEQRRIVDVMAAVDGQIEALGAESAASAVARRAMLGELQGVANDSRQTTLGDLVNELGGSIKTGPFGTALKAREYASDGGVPVISTGEIRHGFLQIHPKTPVVGAEIQARLSAYLLRHGDIVFARKGAVDRSAWVKKNESGYFLGSDGLRVRINVAPEDSRFVAYLLQSDDVLAWLELNATGTIMKGLNQKILAAIPMGIPHDDVRHGYVSRLDLIERVLKELLTELRHLRALRSTLLSSLLSQDVEIPESYDAVLTTDLEVAS